MGKKKYLEELKRLDKIEGHLKNVEPIIKDYPSAMEELANVRNVIERKRKQITESAEYI